VSKIPPSSSRTAVGISNDPFYNDQADHRAPLLRLSAWPSRIANGIANGSSRPAFAANSRS